MEPIYLHPQGPRVSPVVAGVWRWHKLPAASWLPLITAAIDAGITTFDHADIYGDYSNESAFGGALKHEPTLKTKIQIVTKCGIKLLSAARPHRVKHYDTGHSHIIASAEQSLKLLGVEKIDVLLLHRPDPLMNIDELATAFSQLHQQGKVLHFGVSNFTPSQFSLLQSALAFRLVTNQIELSLFHSQPLFDGTVDMLYQQRARPMAWSPLGGGKPLAQADQLSPPVASLLEKYDASLSQVLIAWLLRHPAGIVPVLGTTQTERLREGADALKLHLDREDWFTLLQWARGYEVP